MGMCVYAVYGVSKMWMLWVWQWGRGTVVESSSTSQKYTFETLLRYKSTGYEEYFYDSEKVNVLSTPLSIWFVLKVKVFLISDFKIYFHSDFVLSRCDLVLV